MATGVPVGDYSTFDLLSTFAALPGASIVGATVTRLHLRLWIDSAVAAGDTFSIGLVVADNNQATTAAQPIVTPFALNPTEQPDADWMLFQIYKARPTYNFSAANNCIEVDVKSRRRLPELQDTLLFVFENRAAGAAMNYSYHARTLLALP